MQKKIITLNIYILAMLFLLNSCNFSLTDDFQPLTKGKTASLTTIAFSQARIKNNDLLFDLSLSKTAPQSINFYIFLETAEGESIPLVNAKVVCETLQYSDPFLDCSKHTHLYKWRFTAGKHTASIKLPLQQRNFSKNFVLKIITFNTFISQQNHKSTIKGKNILLKPQTLVNTPDKINLLENYGSVQVPVELNTNDSFSITYSVQQITEKTIHLLDNHHSIATANEDFVPAQGHFDISPSQALQKLSINVIDDQIYEGAQSFVLSLYSDQAIFEGNRQKHILITIDDNEEAPYLQLSDFTTTETEDLQYWPVSLSWPSEVIVSFDYHLHSVEINNAEGDSDYISDRGHIEFASGETQKQISVQIVSDNIPEDTESFSLSILQTHIAQLQPNAPTNYTAFITDASSDTAAPSLAFSAPRINARKGHRVSIPIVLQGSTTTAVHVYYRSFSQSAKAEEDFEDLAGVLYFPASTKTYQVQNIIVNLLDNSLNSIKDVKKSFYLYIEKVQNGKIGTNRRVDINIL
ncbi:MAG: hypothetical protein HAW63_02705 [Bdellovibrionaceae bacterium]|nr:hypothetical protein [Pseudobdellovibrionaceae bacterium]